MLARNHLEPITKISDTYDAFLPLPYFHIGSEQIGYIIDDNNEWSTSVFQISIKNKLPMIASKMSRTPLYMAEKQFSWFSDQLDPALKQKLLEKKIMIIHSPAQKGRAMNDEPAKSISDQPELLIEKRKAVLIKDSLDLRFYEVDLSRD